VGSSPAVRTKSFSNLRAWLDSASHLLLTKEHLSGCRCLLERIVVVGADEADDRSPEAVRFIVGNVLAENEFTQIDRSLGREFVLFVAPYKVVRAAILKHQREGE
jgi:hypothetical protein